MITKAMPVEAMKPHLQLQVGSASSWVGPVGPTSSRRPRSFADHRTNKVAAMTTTPGAGDASYTDSDTSRSVDIYIQNAPW